MKKHVICLGLCQSLLCLFTMGCTGSTDSQFTATSDIKTTQIETRTPTLISLPSVTNTPSRTPHPTITLTPTEVELMFPAVTMSSQEAEDALIALLKTNGNCTGKCLAGIRPDEMNLQEALKVLAQWGMIRIGEDIFGNKYINLDQEPQFDAIQVYISVGPWTNDLSKIETVLTRVEGVSLNYLPSDYWVDRSGILAGFRIEKILDTYGDPTFIGFFFATYYGPEAHEDERPFLYSMEIHFQHLNIQVNISGPAYFDGENLFICPKTDPHNVWIWVNPESPLIEYEEKFPVTWQELSGEELSSFTDLINDKDGLNNCLSTTVEKIESLQPGFR
jgi:hypothetical protein